MLRYLVVPLALVFALTVVPAQALAASSAERLLLDDALMPDGFRRFSDDIATPNSVERSYFNGRGGYLAVFAVLRESEWGAMESCNARAALLASGAGRSGRPRSTTAGAS
jgi:hypothetical protein